MRASGDLISIPIQLAIRYNYLNGRLAVCCDSAIRVFFSKFYEPNTHEFIVTDKSLASSSDMSDFLVTYRGLAYASL